MNLSADTVVLATGASEEDAAKWAPAILAACEKFGIAEPRYMADLMIKMGKASAGLTSLQDDFMYTADDLAAARPNTYAESPFQHPARGNIAARDMIALHAEEAAEMIEEGSWAYRGVGPVRMKGKAAFEKFAEHMGVGSVDPESLKEPEMGAMSAAYLLSFNGVVQMTMDANLRAAVVDHIAFDNAAPPEPDVETNGDKATSEGMPPSASGEVDPNAENQPPPPPLGQESEPAPAPTPGKKRRS